jgi:hypothetical protein
MTDRGETPRPGPQPGLCGTCRHSRLIESKRGSIFRLCQRSATDPSFPRYPALPVLRCAGYDRDDRDGRA